MMLDSGVSVSLVWEDTVMRLPGLQLVSKASVYLVSAMGEPIPVLGRVLSRSITPWVVVQSLIAPVILGIDFLQAYGLILDFTTTPVHVTTRPTPYSNLKKNGQQVLYKARRTKAKVCAIQEAAGISEETIDYCAIPKLGESSSYDMPSCTRSKFSLFYMNTVSYSGMQKDKPIWQST